VHDLDGIAAKLELSDVRPHDGGNWTAERFQSVVKQLGW
jgi:hypothetical protein